MEILDQVVIAGKTIRDMKADNITVYDFSKTTAVTKYYILATSSSNVQGRACANAVAKELESAGVELFNKEGNVQSDWVVLDYYDFAVHITTAGAREHYNLDKLWADGKNAKKFETLEKELDEKAKKAAKKALAKSKNEEKTAAKVVEKAVKKEKKATKKTTKETKKAEDKHKKQTNKATKATKKQTEKALKKESQAAKKRPATKK